MQQGFKRVVSIALAAGSLAASSWIGSAARAQEPPPATRAQLLEQGEQLLAQQQYRRAITAFEDANRLSDAAGCAECFLGLSRTYVAWGKAGKGVEMARVALQLNPPKPLLARAHHQLAVALLAQPGRGADAVAEADGAFRRTLELDPGANVDRFNLAGLLLQSGRAEDAVSLARDYLKGAPTGGAATEARMLICLARKAAPPADPAAEAGAEIEPPHPLYRQPPAYSDRARRDKLQGSVLVQVNIDVDGCAGNPSLVRGMGNELDAAAVEAARRWVFQPATAQGRPVPGDSIVSINFTKDNETVKDPDKAYRDKLLAGWPAQ